MHVIRDFRAKLIRHLYPGDRIKVIEPYVELRNQNYLIIENSSPVFCKRKIINQDNETTGMFDISYLIRRKN